MDFYVHNLGDFSPSVKISKLPMVYVVATQDFEYIKIGKTKSMKQRLGNLQSGCPFFLFLWCAIRSPKTNEIEKELHSMMSHCRVRGEWFSPKDEDLDKIFDYCNLTNKKMREVVNALL